jgi:hypothetical protein
MKIILTESQIKSLKESLLVETTDDGLTYTTKADQKLYAWDNRWNGVNYTIWQNIPAGTKFKFSKNNKGEYEITAWNSFAFYCSDGKFYSFKRGYTFEGGYLANSLKKKFCDGKYVKPEIIFSNIVKQEGKELETVQDTKCLSTIKPAYNNAVNWWKNKLSEPSFYSKLKKLNNYTDQQTKDWIAKYKNYLSNNISGPFCPKQHTKTYNELFSRVEPKGSEYNAIAFLKGNVNSGMIVFNSYYLTSDIKDVEATMVHEIQHGLYNLKPMTPSMNWKKVFPYKVWSDHNEKSDSGSADSGNEKSISFKYGIEEERIKFWKIALSIQKNKGELGYVCRETELASRIVTMKKLLGYSTSQKITVNDFKKFIKKDGTPYDDENAYFIVLCWVYNKMPDIQTFLDNLDEYVVAKIEPKKDDDMKDQII